jgi:hypothetical protein
MRSPTLLRAGIGTAFLLLSVFPPPLSGSPAGERRASVGGEVLRDLAERGEARVIISLRPETAGSAGGLRQSSARRRMDEVLDSLPVGSWRQTARLEMVPAAAAAVRTSALAVLMDDPRVARVDRDDRILGMESGPLVQIGADRVQELGFSGQGVTVAVLDSGTDPLINVDLQPALDAEECFCSNDDGCCPDGTSRESGPGSASSITSHGPGVMGIVASQGIVAPRGVAPSARIVAVRVLDDGLVGTFSDILAAMDWLLVNRPDVRVVNLSIAAGLYPPACDHLSAFNEAMAEYSRILRERGGLLVAASGNNFSPTSMGSPACITGVLSVGAVDAFDHVLSFSNATSALSLLAPGNQIMSTGSFGRIVSLTGTSSAAPFVTGAAALLLSAMPDLSAQDLEERLEGKGVPVFDARNGGTYPRVDAFRSLLLPLKSGSNPGVISRRPRGRGLTVWVEPLPPFHAEDLDPSSFTLRAAGGPPIAAGAQGAELGDRDGDGIVDLSLRFDRRQVLAGVPVSETVDLTVEGSFLEGAGCRGKITLRFVGSGKPVGILDPPP